MHDKSNNGIHGTQNLASYNVGTNDTEVNSGRLS